MKSLKKILGIAATSALALTLGAFALTGCGGDKGYTFEAEEAILTEPEGFEPSDWGAKLMDLEEKKDGKKDITVVGYFSAKGMTITWKINAEEECDASIKIYGSSTKFKTVTKADGTAIEYDWTTWQPTNVEPTDEVKGGIDALPAENSGVSLKVNGSAATMSGTLPGKEVTATFAESSSFYALYVAGQYTANVKLNKGENIIVLEIDGAAGGGFNVDKMVIDASTKLTHTPVDNSDRAAS